MDSTTITLTGILSAGLNALIFCLWKPWLGAYGSEKGKNLARKEDLDLLVAEVKAVTRGQEEIKSQLAGDLWSKQTLWNEKKSVYAQLLNSIHEATKEANQLWLYGATLVAGRFVRVLLELTN